VDLFRGNLSTIPPFHLSTLKDPVDPVIRVLSLFRQHHVTTSTRHHVIMSPFHGDANIAIGKGLEGRARFFVDKKGLQFAIASCPG